MSHRHRVKRRSRRPGRGRRPFALAGAVALLSVIIGGLAAVGYVAAVASDGPSIDELKPIVQGSTSVVYASDRKTRLGFIGGDELRTPVTHAEIPEIVRQATVAIEDRRFYQHHGVDYTGVARAAAENVAEQKTVQGGSTITMQLVRNLYITRERTFQRKIKEARLAEELESRHDKAWIIDQYLNNVPYGTNGGQTAVGIQAAARVFFNKQAKDLTLPEAALLSGLPQAPSEYNPFSEPRRAIERRNEVLGRMRAERTITAAEASRAMAAPLRTERNRYYQQKRANYFFDYVKQQLVDRYGLATVRQGGLRIDTTIDLDKQNAAKQAIDAQLSYPGAPASAVVTVEPRTGAIKAMATSGTYGDNKFNYAAQGQRQPGSTFKVMVLLDAVRRGINPESVSYDSRKLNPGWLPSNPSYEVSTFDNSFGGRMNLVKATLKSDNTVYAQLDADLGPESVRKTAYDMGITSKLKAYPAEGLGSADVSPLEMAAAYSTIASNGLRARPTAIRKVTFASGKVERFGKAKPKRAFQDGVTYEVTKVLKQNVKSGTAVRADIGCPAAGKTGTTSDFKDAWFVGYTPKLSTAVWVGYPTPRPLYFNGGGMQGGSLPAQLWSTYMRQAKRGYCGDFPRPKKPASFAPFYGKYATTGVTSGRSSGSDGLGGTGTGPGATGGSGAGVTPPGPSGAPGGGTTGGDTGGTTGGGGSTGGGGTGGYDPRFYDSQPQG